MWGSVNIILIFGEKGIGGGGSYASVTILAYISKFFERYIFIRAKFPYWAKLAQGID